MRAVPKKTNLILAAALLLSAIISTSFTRPAAARFLAPDRPGPITAVQAVPIQVGAAGTDEPFQVYLSTVFANYNAHSFVEVPSPLVQTMIDQVNTTSLGDLVSDLSGERAAQVGGQAYTIMTRYSASGEPIQKAIQYAYEHFQATGLNTQYHDYSFDFGGDQTLALQNIIAEQPGRSQPEEIYILTAHLDSTSRSDPGPYTIAPGADDNASGSAAVLNAAQILSQYTFECTLRYALFTGEEQGLYGSKAYAATVKEQGDNIQGVLNLDMIAYNTDEFPIIDLHARPNNAADLRFATLFSEVITGYHLSLTPEIFADNMGSSDHVPFWNMGFSAIFAIEDDDDFNENYHRNDDQIENMDMAYYTEFVKAAVGTLAHMGCLLETQP